MKTPSKWVPAALVVASIMLVAYIGVLLVSNYLSQVGLQKDALERLRHEMEKRATAVSYFYSERQGDLKTLAASRALEVFFENRALGMTMEYGLGASLIDVYVRLTRIIEERKIDGNRIYTRVVFIDDSGKLLVDSSGKGREHEWKRFLAPGGKDATIVTWHDGKLLMTMASIPYFFKGEYSGQIVAWISPEIVYKHFIKTEGVASERVIYIVCGGDHLHLPADVQSKIAFSGLFDPKNVKIGEIHSFKTSGVEMLALCVPVRDTPFSMIAVLPASEVFGHTSPWYLLFVMGILSVVILGGGVFVLRINTRNLTLRVRFEEAKRREREIEEKKELLEEEIFMRQQAEERLKEYSVNLEKMVRERTSKLENALNDLQETQAQLLQSEKMASIGELAAGVAHEINNPINGIINYAQILVDQSDGQDEVTGIAGRIIKEGDRIAGIVKNLLAFAREWKEESGPALIQDILADSLGLVERQILKDGIRLKVDIPPGLPGIRVRKQHIQQVFLNILSNVRHALNRRFPGFHEDKVLEIGSEVVEIEGRRHIRTTFYDRGTGIPVDILGRICNPFFSTKPRGEGTGMGLSISHGIIKDHAGRLRFDSVEGEYTKAMVDLPVDTGQEVEDKK